MYAIFLAVGPARTHGRPQPARQRGFHHAPENTPDIQHRPALHRPRHAPAPAVLSVGMTFQNTVSSAENACSYCLTTDATWADTGCGGRSSLQCVAKKAGRYSVRPDKRGAAAAAALHAAAAAAAAGAQLPRVAGLVRPFNACAHARRTHMRPHPPPTSTSPLLPPPLPLT